MENQTAGYEKFLTILLIVLALVGLYMTSLYNYLLFHGLAEIFSIVVASGMFMIAWNSRKHLENDYLMFIAIAYLFVAFLDLLHTLSYKGMSLFKDYDYYANQLWIATRYIESLTLMIGFTLFGRSENKNRVQPHLIFFIYSIVTTIVILSIFTWKIFPVCFIEEKGLTPFKKISEYIICLILVVDMALLYRYKDNFEKNIFQLIAFSILFTIISELAFTFYIDNYGFSNLIGHYFKIFSFYAIYKAIIATGIIRPHDIIFRELILKEKNLQEAKEAADNANKAKSEFLSNMSHELRTPLNGILGYAQILKRDPHLAPNQKSGVDVIERSGKHLLNLINEILDLSKIEAKKMELHETNFQFREFLDEISKIIEIRARQKGISLYSDFSPDLPKAIRCDEKRLSQILLNLLGNAVKFTEKGHVMFRAIVSKAGLEEKSDSVTVRIEVEDTGIGIPKDKFEDIFLPFKQVGDPQKMMEGTGLGLSISRKLVNLMGSDLRVKSTIGKGSTFCFDLKAPIALEWRLSVRSDEQNIIGYEGDKKYKILSVDDNWENRKVLMNLLSPIGFDIVDATNGREGFEKAIQFKPDLIFMDLVMPEMNGYEASQQIRAHTDPNPKIIAVSASYTLSSAEELEDSLFDDFIPKPFDFQIIFNKLADHLNLIWNYRDTTELDESDSDPMIIPEKKDIEMLQKLAKMGDVMGIRKKLDHIEASGNDYHAFVKEIRKLTDSFQIRQLRDYLQEIMNDE